ncbi:glycosyl transferase [Microbacterium sp. CH12i]|uniref:glycosyltransferase n=1 Tax=Microbacterium sp. CH12i TaxID=1479651 RepID=UPI000460F19A|nr:glycosyltransferase [Microbacterium sp. CH12i]KDA04906.1 glycosyl transferase [Microbacterium sp. CH12i]
MTGLLVHEWVAKAGGSENVVEQFVKSFPTADLQVLWNDDPGRFSATTYETWIARTPLRRSKMLALPFLPATWRTLQAHQQYEWLLTSSHLFAHHVQLRGLDREVPKFSYVHTPARYIWEPELDHRGRGPLVRLAAGILKPLDRKRAQESFRIAANSEFTRKRIERAWGRDSDVIYPPVDTDRIIAGGDWRNHLTSDELDTLEALPSEFLLGASRFVSYKRLDLVIEAGEATKLPVVLAGRGPDHDALLARAQTAAVPVTFVISPSDEMLYALYQRALALVFPAIEDFGIMPVEAMAAGTPVVVPNVGGALESVTLAEGGSTIDNPSTQGWREAIETALSIDRSGLPSRTSQFSTTHFRQLIQTWVLGSQPRGPLANDDHRQGNANV